MLNHKQALWIAILAIAVGSALADDLSILEPPGISVDGMLQRAGMLLFHTPPGAPLDVQQLHEHTLLADRCEILKYEVKIEGGARVGQFLRVRVFPDTSSVIDIAAVIEGGKVTAVEPLRPVVVSGQPYLNLPQALIGLTEEELASGAATGLTSIFHALTFLDEAIGIKTPPRPTEVQARQLVEAIHTLTPQLSLGSGLPDFASTDEAGKTFGPARLAGQRAVVLMGSVDQPLSRDIMSWVTAYSGAHPGAFLLAEVLQNAPETIEEFRRLGGVTSGIVVPDLSLEVYAAFHTALSPCLFLYDRHGKLRLVLEPPFTTAADLGRILESF